METHLLDKLIEEFGFTIEYLSAHTEEDTGNFSSVIEVDEAINLANAKLRTLLSDARVVYGKDDKGHMLGIMPHQSPSDTHTALLIQIKPIKKKCEEHEPTATNLSEWVNRAHVILKCRYCGVALKTEWRAVEEEMK